MSRALALLGAVGALAACAPQGAPPVSGVVRSADHTQGQGALRVSVVAWRVGDRIHADARVASQPAPTARQEAANAQRWCVQSGAPATDRRCARATRGAHLPPEREGEAAAAADGGAVARLIVRWRPGDPLILLADGQRLTLTPKAPQ